MRSVYIIAEAGVNHNGDIAIAKQLIDVAARAGVDAVKFQTFKADKLLTKDAPKAKYQEDRTGISESQYDMIKKLELDESDHEVLVEYCKEKKVDFLSAPFDIESVELLSGLGLTTWKIPSGEITNLPLLRSIARHAQNIILSTGMCDMEDIRAAVKALVSNGLQEKNLTLLHCNTEYPTPFAHVNLKAMLAIQDEFSVAVGYSDHTIGIEVPVAAVAMGAVVIEKHFTLDKSLPGPDHKASLDPEELAAMVRSIRNIEQSLGDGVKVPSASEIKNRDIARKSIVAAASIKKGERFSAENLDVKRPGTGLSPMLWDRLIGSTAQHDYQKDDIIKENL